MVKRSPSEARGADGVSRGVRIKNGAPLETWIKNWCPQKSKKDGGWVSPPSAWDAEKTSREAGTQMEKGSRGWVHVSLGVQIGQYLTCGELGRRAWGSEVCSRPTGRIELGAGLETGEAGVPGTPQTRTTQVAQAAASSSSAALRAQGSGLQTRPGDAGDRWASGSGVTSVLECMAGCGRLRAGSSARPFIAKPCFPGSGRGDPSDPLGRLVPARPAP